MTLSPGRRLRDAMSAGPVPVPGVFCPLAARLAERMGFPACYLSGAALSASLGLPDLGLLGATEFSEAARAICAASSLPLLCDADTGFGEALGAARTVQLYEAAGAGGLHLEDQVLPKRCGHLSGKALVDAATMAAKVRAAASARRDPGFLLVARTDARGVEGFDAAVERARRYLDAGADSIFPEALEGEEEFARFARALPGVPLLANMTEFGKSPIIDRAVLGQMGYRLVLYPVTGLRAAMKAARDVFADILGKGHQRDAPPRMMTRADLYD
ncbi:MAG: isocitrate lyase/phosphoenolpyruvate mutase family protein, partial [Gemmataceae bacterium]|nr:isocitrate lyase/phosphoenolpyruvate mutase family protein [Gemmataceae bacterium]